MRFKNHRTNIPAPQDFNISAVFCQALRENIYADAQEMRERRPFHAVLGTEKPAETDRKATPKEP
jgi:hypothetical protein